jgi:hypothetical protein
MSQKNFEYHLPAAAPIRQKGAEPIAAVLYLEGRCHFVGRGSHAEIELVERGALHVGLLRFDLPVTVKSRHAVQPVSAADLLEARSGSPVRN